MFSDGSILYGFFIFSFFRLRKQTLSFLSLHYMSSRPLVSILVATQDRPQFIPQLLRHIRAQTYPQERLEIVVGDDGRQSSGHMWPRGTKILRYQTPVRLGKKRNDLKRAARGEFLVTMDDDDYYFPRYVEHAVEVLSRPDSVGIAALDTAYVFYPIRWSLEVSGPWRDAWPGASFCYTQEYARRHQFHTAATSGEEWLFTDWHRIIPDKLDPEQTMIVTSHKGNCSNKNSLVGRRTAETRLEDHVKDAASLHFYRVLAGQMRRAGPQWATPV